MDIPHLMKLSLRKLKRRKRQQVNLYMRVLVINFYKKLQRVYPLKKQLKDSTEFRK